VSDGLDLGIGGASNSGVRLRHVGRIDTIVSVSRILVVTGASGAGKTATVRALDARAVSGVRCFYFDSIGVPTAEVMERDYGSGEQWQAAATAAWLARLGALPRDIRLAVLDAQTRPSFVFDAAARAAPRTVSVVLLDCSSNLRAARLHGPRQQPQLANAQMDHWAAYLRGQADALGLTVIDMSILTITEAAEKLEQVVRGLIDPDAPAA